MEITSQLYEAVVRGKEAELEVLRQRLDDRQMQVDTLRALRAIDDARIAQLKQEHEEYCKDAIRAWQNAQRGVEERQNQLDLVVRCATEENPEGLCAADPQNSLHTLAFREVLALRKKLAAKKRK